jgi:hypothetical protein
VASKEEAAAKLKAIEQFAADPWLAQRFFFPHRMTDAAAAFHKEICDDFWFGARRKQILGFRGCGKSTVGESNITLAGCLRAFKNLVIIGASEARAAERLAVVAYQLTMNDAIRVFFGDQKGSVWTQTKLVLASGYCIQALGRDQDIRGLKHLDWRPDFWFIDDFEDKENVQTPAARERTYDWFLGELLLAGDPAARVLVNGTPLDEESVPVRLEREAGWPTRTVPVEYLDGDGERRASWPERFPMAWIDTERRAYVKAGRLRLWEAEMMCVARSAASQVFTKDMLRHEPRERSWQAVYAMIDPARSTNRQSATTGWAVWSWIGGRLVVWAAGAEALKPDEIIALAFAIDEGYGPVWLGIEEDGLNEWLKQPMRAEMVRRGRTIPFKPIRAPRSKLDFIRGLQPFYDAREVIHNGPLPELEEQLMAFPTGHIDAPNALAYCLPMRPGALIYENFGEDHIAAELEPVATKPLYLAANADRTYVTAALVQFADGQLRIFADWVIEGSPAEIVGDIHAEAALVGETGRMVERTGQSKRDWTEMLKLPERRLEFARLPIRWITPPHHKDRWNNVGLNQAIARIPSPPTGGASEAAGRQVLGDVFGRLARARQAVVVSSAAGWTLRGLAGGYSRAVARGGRLAEHVEDGPYRTLIEGIESFAGMMARADVDAEDEDAQGYSFDKHGRRYKSAMPAR